jgi:MerR family transcriptional regulator, copper efflux regulator
MLIGELAALSGLSKDGIRHYEELGLINSTPRPAGSREYRDYDVHALDMILKVRNAQRLGFALRDIGPLIKAYEAKSFSIEETISILSDRLQEVRDKITELRQTEAYIEEKIALYEKTHNIDPLVHSRPKAKRHAFSRHRRA